MYEEWDVFDFKIKDRCQWVVLVLVCMVVVVVDVSVF